MLKNASLVAVLVVSTFMSARLVIAQPVVQENTNVSVPAGIDVQRGTGEAAQLHQEIQALQQQAAPVRAQLEQLEAQVKPLREQLRGIHEKIKANRQKLEALRGEHQVKRRDGRREHKYQGVTGATAADTKVNSATAVSPK